MVHSLFSPNKFFPPGPAGVSALKSLLDEGFDVTAFERRPNVGGVWTQSEHPDHVSTINCTTYQTSKFSCPISDYPVPDGKTMNKRLLSR
jgi:dimethylaniline monooxygenase (N-oxide forming)